MAYSSDRNSIHLKMTKWKRILEIIPFSLLGFFVFFPPQRTVTFPGHRAEH